MQSLGTLLRKRIKSPIFQKALQHGGLQKHVEQFFKKEGLDARFEDYDEKKRLLTLRVPHPSLAHEALFLQEKLARSLEKQKLPSSFKVKAITRS